MADSKDNHGSDTVRETDGAIAGTDFTEEQQSQILYALDEALQAAGQIVRYMDTNLSLLEASRLESDTALGILRDSNQMSEMRLAKAA
jgi:hypothetical protein